MEVLRTIALYTEGKSMPFLLIGGHALGVYGIHRQTGDIDILVPLLTKDAWLILLDKLGYYADQNDSRFTHLRHPQIGTWPIDLMFVDDATFSKLSAESKRSTIGVATVFTVSAKHLAVLKIHALKYYQEHRYVKDYNDLLQLLKLEATQISQKDLHEFCLRYANNTLFDKLISDLKW